MANAKITMKLLVNKTKNKVLFAEAKKECVDFFLHILSLPLATIMGLVGEKSMSGSLGSLYGSLRKIEPDYLLDGLNKDRLLNPKPASGSPSNVFPLLAIDDAVEDPVSKRVYICSSSNVYDNYSNNVHLFVSDTAGAICPYCRSLMNKTLTRVDPPPVETKIGGGGSSGGGGYVKGLVTYMIMDDLSMEPISTISGIMLVNKFNAQDVSSLEEKFVTLEMNLVVALVKASLVSKTVLTDVFLGKKPK